MMGVYSAAKIQGNCLEVTELCTRDAFVTTSRDRSRDYGLLLNFVEDWAREKGCSSVALASGLQRTDPTAFTRLARRITGPVSCS